MNNWENNLTDLMPYEAGEQIDDHGVIKLNANENPYPPSPAVEKALREFDYRKLKKYPKRGDNILSRAVSECYKVNTKNVFCANSSDEVLALSFKAFFNSKRPILFPDITYTFYKVWCRFFDIDYKTIPLSEELQINIDDYYQKELNGNGGIIMPNPNAPTGIQLSIDEIDMLLSKNQDSVVIIDEAYSDFGSQSAVKLVKKYENLLVVKTTSKSRSLAGLRVGYALGSEILINALNNAVNSFNAYPLSSLSMELAAASFYDTTYFNSTVEKIKETKSKVESELSKLGFVFTESSTNFLLVKHESISGEKLYKYLYDNKILVRYFGNSNERLRDYLRITIGTDNEMDQLIETIKESEELNAF